MLINLREVTAASGQKIRFDYTVDLSHEQVHFAYPFQEPVRLCGAVSDELGVYKLSAVIETNLHLRCSRCDRPFTREKSVDVFFILAKDLQNEDNDEMIAVESDAVEIDDILLPELFLAMDMAELCAPDCKGVCHSCGQNFNDGECSCAGEETDPRWESLRSLLDDKQ